MKRAVWILSATAILGGEIAAIAASDFDPIAMAVHSVSRDIYALSQRGHLYRISSVDGDPKLIYKFPEQLTFADMATTEDRARGNLYVLAFTPGLGRSVVLSYNISSGQIRRQLLAEASSSLALDPDSRTLYLAFERSREVHALAIDSLPPRVAYFTSIPRIGGFGPMVADPRTKSIFVADALEGTLYTIDLSTRKAKRSAFRLGEPRDIVWDAPRSRVLVCDAAGKRVYSVVPGAETTRPVLFFSGHGLREPSAIVVEHDRVWVGDRAGKAVYVLSLNGSLERIIRPR